MEINNTEKAAPGKKINFKAILMVAAVIAIGIAAYNIYSSLGATKRPIIEVNVATATEQKMTGEYSVSGTLSPAQSANITSRISGKILAVYAKKGDLVKAGDLLVQIDDTDVQLQSGAGGMAKDNVQKFKISYELADELYLKNKNLYENGAIAEMTYEQSKVAMEQAKIQYQTAASALSEQIQKTRITAPISGIVVALTVQKADSVSQGSQILSIVDMNQVILKGTVPESIVGYTQLAQEVSVWVDSLYGQAFKGKISFISPVSIPAGQIFPVEIIVDNIDGKLRAGMTAFATIKAEISEPVLTVPTGAVFERDGKKYVYLLQDDQAVMSEVRIGLQNSELTAINSGITKGTRVVASNTELLMNGDRVKSN